MVHASFELSALARPVLPLLQSSWHLEDLGELADRPESPVPALAVNKRRITLQLGADEKKAVQYCIQPRRQFPL
jgi:hypothetical protein